MFSTVGPLHVFNGTVVFQGGDRVGVRRKADGTLHFYVNGVDQGLASTSVPELVYGVIDLYGQAAQATMVYENTTGMLNVYWCL